MSAEFRREVRFIKGYDRTLEKGKGRHGMEIALILHGPLGAISGRISTGWCPMRPDGYRQPMGDHFPTGFSVSLHSPAQRKDWWMGPDKCDVLNGQCYGDVGYMVSDTLLERLVDQGEEAAWDYLRELYDAWFADDEEAA